MTHGLAVVAAGLLALLGGRIVSVAEGAAPGVPAAGAPAAGAPSKWIVLCAPGYPGTTLQAQPTMDRFAQYIEQGTGVGAGKLGAVYYETEKGGLDRFGAKDAVLAIVPLPFLLEHGAKLELKPILQAEADSGASEEWSLVAKKGALKSSAGLAGYEIVGVPGYAPSFVKGPILGRWGPTPASAKISFAAGVLGPLRRASTGEKVAVIVDRAGAASLGTLPFGRELEIVTRAKPLPGSLVCTVGEKLTPAETSKVLDTLLMMPRSADGADVLTSMRLRRFVPVDSAALDAARAAVKAAAQPAR